jgi:hypothetical protein
MLAPDPETPEMLAPDPETPEMLAPDLQSIDPGSKFTGYPNMRRVFDFYPEKVGLDLSLKSLVLRPDLE